MLITNFASGSKGNSTLLVCGDTKLLIDDGINYKTLKDKMEEVGENPKDLYGILITHTHKDHIGGLAVLVNKTNLRGLQARIDKNKSFVIRNDKREMSFNKRDITPTLLKHISLRGKNKNAGNNSITNNFFKHLECNSPFPLL